MAGDINDGRTRSFTIKARPGIHEELTGTYRPVHPRERMALKHPNMGPDQFAARSFALVVSNTKSWNRPGKIDEASVGALDPNEFLDLLDYILGYNYAEADEAEKNS